jgi:MFS family permease
MNRPTWVRWHIVALLVGYSFMTWFNRVSMSVAYDERIKAEYGIAPEVMGTVYSAFLLFYMVCMTPGGWLIDRSGPRRALVWMGFGSAVFGALTAVAGLPALATAGLVLPALLLVRSLMGVCTAPIYPAASRVVAHWMPPGQRARANGLVQGAALVGIAVVFHVFGWLIDEFDWPTAFVLSGTVTALVALLWTVYATDDPAQHAAVNEAERRLIAGQAPNRAVGSPPPECQAPVAASSRWTTLLRDRSLLMLTLSYAAVGYVEYLFFFWVHYYFEKVLGIDKDASRDYSAALNLAMAAGMVVGGWLSDRLEAGLGRRRGRPLVPIIGLCAGAGLLVAGVLVEETALIVICLALALAAVGAVEAPTWTTAVELGGKRGGLAAGICNTGGNAGGLIAPVLTPLVGALVHKGLGFSEVAGWQWGIGLGAAVGLAGAALWAWVRLDDTHRPAEKVADEDRFDDLAFGRRPE